jgi:SAM-dependent methyltransferase
MRKLLGRIRRLHDVKRPETVVSWTYAESILSAVTHAECEQLAHLAVGARVLEIGSYYGRSTVAMASTAIIVHSVDPHMGGPPEAPSTLAEFLANLESFDLRERVVVHVATTNELADILQSEVFDLVFVDAMHQRPEVDFDLALAARSVCRGGTIAFHDYGRDGVMVGDTWHPFGVTEAVDEFVALAGLGAPIVIESLGVVRVPDWDSSSEHEDFWRVALAALPITRV